MTKKKKKKDKKEKKASDQEPAAGFEGNDVWGSWRTSAKDSKKTDTNDPWSSDRPTKGTRSGAGMSGSVVSLKHRAHIDRYEGDEIKDPSDRVPRTISSDSVSIGSKFGSERIVVLRDAPYTATPLRLKNPHVHFPHL